MSETVGANRAYLDAACRAAGTTTMPETQTERMLAEKAARPKREIVNHSDANDLEAAVLRECGQLLAVHPAIVLCVRQNGGMVETAAGAPVWFYRWVRSPRPMALTDFWGISRKGLFAVECKRRNWHWGNPSAREQEQQAFITATREAGGWGGFVTSAEDLMQLLGGK